MKWKKKKNTYDSKQTKKKRAQPLPSIDIQIQFDIRLFKELHSSSTIALNSASFSTPVP